MAKDKPQDVQQEYNDAWDAHEALVAEFGDAYKKRPLSVDDLSDQDRKRWDQSQERVKKASGRMAEAMGWKPDQKVGQSGSAVPCQDRPPDQRPVHVGPAPGTKTCEAGPETLKPIDDEAGLARTKEIRSALDVGNRRTVAFAEVDIEGLPKEIVSFSGDHAKPGLERRFREANPDSFVAGPTARTGPGRNDAEVKILDQLRKWLDPSAKGTIRLFVDQPEQKGICEHCTRAILEFQRDFPGIVLLPSSL